MNKKDNATKKRRCSGRSSTFNRCKAQKHKAHQRGVVIISAIALAILVFAIVLISKGCSNNKMDAKLIGVWQYNRYTEYEFKSGNNGCMCLDGNTHYEFTYSIKENILYIDFTPEYVTDCQYTYTLEGNKLILVGGEGTAEIGEVYQLTKIEK